MSVVRAGERRRGARATATRCSRRRCPACGRRSRFTRSPPAPHRRAGRPADARAWQPRDRRRDRGPAALRCGGTDHELEEGDCVTFDADLPHHFENPGDGEAALLRRRRRRPEEELTGGAQNPVRQDLGRARGRRRPALHRPPPRAEVTSPQAFESLRLAGRRCAAPIARLPPPTTTCPPTARPAAQRSATSSRACRSRRSSATAREVRRADLLDRLPARASCT